jgi:hypothetical protein
VVSKAPEYLCQGSKAVGDIGMLLAEGLLSDRQSSPAQRQCSGKILLLTVEVGQVVQGCGDFKVLRAKKLLGDGQTPLKKKLGLLIIA